MHITAVYAMSKSPFDLSLISLKSDRCKSSKNEINKPLHISLIWPYLVLFPGKKGFW